MEELAAQNPSNLNGSEDIYDSDDEFAQVLGKDKYGQVRMYGTGVTASDFRGGKSSRATLLRQNAEYKEKLDALNTKIEELTAYIYKRPHFNEQHDSASGQDGTPNGLRNSQSPPLSSMDGYRSSSPISHQMHIRVNFSII